MRIMVVSDSHDCPNAIEEAIKQEKEKEKGFDAFIFLGDGEDDYDIATRNLGGITTYRVRGNNDWNHYTPLYITAQIGQHKYFICHGHSFNVWKNCDRLVNAASQAGCQVVLFGHTHCRYYGYQNSVHIFNPGSIALPRDGHGCSYGIITEEKGKLDFFYYNI